MINSDYYAYGRSKLIYAKNWFKQRALQYLQTYVWWNSIKFCPTITDLFYYLKDSINDLYEKKCDMQKFGVLKMRTQLFCDLYSKSIQLASDLVYTSEMLIGELKCQLTTPLLHWLSYRTSFKVLFLW